MNQFSIGGRINSAPARQWTPPDLEVTPIHTEAKLYFQEQLAECVEDVYPDEAQHYRCAIEALEKMGA